MFRTLLVTSAAATLTVVGAPAAPAAASGISVADTAGADACSAYSVGDGVPGDCVFSATPGHYLLHMITGGSSATGRVRCEPFGPYGNDLTISGPGESRAYHHLPGGLCVIEAFAAPGDVSYVYVAQ